MIGQRVEITGTLTVQTPLHIGDGDTRAVPRGNEKTMQIATVARDGTGAPYIPGSSLKGVLRDALAGLAGAETLLGPQVIDADHPGKSGRVIFRNAWFKALPPDAARHAAARRKPEMQAPHAALMVEAHVGKDADNGVAAKAKLFHADMVLPGTTFALSLAWLENGPPLRKNYSSVQKFAAAQVAAVKDAADAKLALMRLLSLLTSPDGLPFGQSTRQGLGRVWLDPASIAFDGVAENVVPVLAAKADWQLRLSSATPFLIHDPHRTQPKAEPGETQRSNAQLALQGFDGPGARLTGSSVLGALRAAFDDFAKRLALREGRICARKPIANDGTDRDGFTHLDELETLRLFGTTDQRGRVGVLRLTAKDKGEGKTITSVKIDRFSGATIDNALFTTEGWFDTAFDLDLTLETRRSQDEMDQAWDENTFRDFLALLQDPDWGGLMLGHGGSKGYGWFKVEVRI